MITGRVTPPHLRLPRTTAQVMGEVCLSLIPPSVAAVYFFGWAAVYRLAVSVAACAAADAIAVRRRGDPFDFSAVVTGLILALSCPAGIPLWLLVVLGFTAILLVREAFGGIGSNLFNPAMGARALLLTVFPALAGGYALPDAVSAATPLSLTEGVPLPELLTWLVGRKNGSMGETSALMILLGAVWLIARRVVRWYVPPLSLTAFSAVMLLGGRDPIQQLLSGSILFGAVYIFTDYIGRPATPWGEVLFAAGAGALTALLRLYGPYPEGVCFAVLLMNALTPLLESLTAPRVYGMRRRALPVGKEKHT